MSQSFRIEHDSMGELQVPADALWGAQTQRAIDNFHISGRPMPASFVKALALVKASAALVNGHLGLLDRAQADAIVDAAAAIAAGAHAEQFPIDRYQTGSGTSSNMNANEVIAHTAAQASKLPIHPNDHVNLGQSSNDVIPTALRVMAAVGARHELLPALAHLRKAIDKRAKAIGKTVKTGRTHLMDATPVTFGQELSAFVAQLDYAKDAIEHSLPAICQIAQGGTAVGTGLNSHPHFAEKVAAALAQQTGLPLTSAPNKFAALAGHERLVILSGALKTLAVVLMKLANDLRLLGSGPRAGFAEVLLPANEPGSSIMPGKVNPTQCEALSMLACQVIGNDTTVSLAASQGHLQLNVFKPVIVHNLLESIGLLADGCVNFQKHCVEGMRANEQQMAAHLENGLMLVTALNRHIGYDNAAKIAKKAYEDNITLRQAAIALELVTDEQFSLWVRPHDMLKPE